MQHALLFFFSLCCSFCMAQNLVPNPSFEEYTDCPTSMDGISNLAYWFSARYSPDYFNPCANTETPYVGVPNNFGGYQMPFEGKAYAGIVTRKTTPPPLVNYREILETPLTQPLTIGLRYYVSTYISSARADYDDIKCFSNNVGFRFTNVRHSVYMNIAPEAPIDNFSHIRSADIITDTTDWVWVGGSFVADSAYQYLMLGNFYNDNHTDTVCISSSYETAQAYYYIDNVCVSTDSTENRIPTSISNINSEKNSIYAFPNPAINTLSIRNMQHYKSFLLLNSLGQKVKEGKLTDEITTIDISKYERGIYFLLINGSASKILFIN